MPAHDDHFAATELQNDTDEVPKERISGILPRPPRLAAMPTRHRVAVRGPRARDRMREAPMVVRASSKIRTAVEMFRSLDVRCLPVVNDGGVLVGMLSDRDLRSLRIPYFIGNEYVGNLQTVLEMPVMRLLTGNIIAVHEDASVFDALAWMLNERIAIVPVTNGDGVLVGVISYLELLSMWPALDAVSDAAG